MSEFKIEKDMNIVKILTAQAKNERVESDKIQEMDKQIANMLQDFNPQNRYAIAQLVGFTLTDLNKTTPTIEDYIADKKVIGMGDKATFSVPSGVIKAIIHAKGATVPRSRVADRTILVDTVSVSARPSVSIFEIMSGRKNMADMVRDANIQMNLAKNARIQNLFIDAISIYASPFYASGQGFVPATFDPMLLHFRRMGGVAILGDPAALDKIAAETGFTPTSGDPQYSGEIINQYHLTGSIGHYRGAQVIPMINGYGNNGTTPILDPSYIYVLSTGISKDSRNLKVVEEGGVIANEETNIEDLSFDIRLDQLFGAALVVGNTPSVGVYEDATL